MAWTEEQLLAMDARGSDILVSAAAGSGKTAVLVERIVRLVREGCPIDRMLVVTFTNAAAGEMRQRIGEALGKAAREDPALGEQVMALSRASISTLHRFCGNLLREHFQALSIDPGFRIGDEQECGVLSHQAMEDAIYSCYEVGSDAFLAADRCYTQEELSELAFALHRFMMTRPDPWAFLARAQETVRLTGEAFEQSPAARLLADFAKYANHDFQNGLDDLLPQKLIPVVIELSGIPGRQKVHDLTREQRQSLLRVLKHFPVEVSAPCPVTDAIVTSGGVKVGEVDPKTMESKLVKNLYFAGELLDTDAYTGGFNLQIAWATGRLAGQSAANEKE